MSHKNKKKKSPPISLIIAFAAYLLVSIVMLFVHEPWRDEAQVWLLVRDLDFWGLVLQMRYEGTPGLWHFLLYPFARLGFPYVTQSILHHLVSICAIALLFLWAPFSNRLKILFAFSYYMLIEYAVFVRHYSLSILLLFVTAIFYHRRFEHPILFAVLIALLANSSLQMLFLSALIGLAYLISLIKQKRLSRATISSVIIILFGGLFAAYQIIPPSDMVFSGICPFPNAFQALFALRAAFFPFSLSTCVFLTSIALFIFVLFVIYAYSRDRWAAAYLVLTSVFLAYIFSCKFISGGFRHYGLYLIILIFVLWIVETGFGQKLKSLKFIHPDYLPWIKRIGYIGLELSLVTSIYFAARFAYQDIRYMYSGAKEMGAFIESELPHEEVAAFPWAIHLSVLPYLSRDTFWYVSFEQEGSYATWSQDLWVKKEISFEEVFKRIRKHYPEDNLPHLLLCVPLDDPGLYGYELRYAVEGVYTYPYFNENYYLYRPMEHPDANGVHY